MERSIVFKASLLAVTVLVPALLPSVCVFAAWQTNGESICTATEDQYPPAITSDGVGSTIVTWNDQRNGNWDIYAARIQYPGTTDVPSAGAAASVLGQNYPNPGNPATLITFSVQVPGVVKFRIYDVAGQALRTLVDGWRGPGVYREIWDWKRDNGASVASGVYFYRLETGGVSATRKMVLLHELSADISVFQRIRPTSHLKFYLAGWRGMS
jgi:hypothetical protein